MRPSDPFDITSTSSQSYTKLIRPWNTVYTRELSVRNLLKRPGDYYSRAELRKLKSEQPRIPLGDRFADMLRCTAQYIFGK